jgi:hypothetical protein
LCGTSQRILSKKIGVRGIGESEGMRPLTIFGLFAVGAMLVCYALERRNRLFVLGFAGACILGSAYGFLQGAWPFGLVEAIWSVVAFRRWWLTRLAN